MSRSLKTNMSPFFRFPKCPKRSWPQHGERSRSGAAGAKRGAGDFLGITSDFFGQIYHHNIYIYIKYIYIYIYIYIYTYYIDILYMYIYAVY